MIPETEIAKMKERVKQAEQQVRETLGWEDPATFEALDAYNLAVSKTAELLEMTSQRDEAQKALDEGQGDWLALLLEISRLYGRIDAEWMDATIREMGEFDPWDALRKLNKDAESAEATIREQSERIKRLEHELKLADIVGMEQCERIAELKRGRNER